ncbi:sugar ABC transporter permease [Vallitalea pronyensis]|uniref:Sugar ABC transporter permease n=1 Tax=Vallitalea pronyensis TaxID=1348613 RepID=A0A8J8MPU1_9FIRM|nr:ABC transporter permease subunit [Vallitalea pronyensis]QUI25760.1 sugar ABC transporter permease [Vallitalea pronyensis]
MNNTISRNNEQVKIPNKHIHKKRRFFKGKRGNIELFILTLPCLIYFFIWHYLPMGGLLLAFKDYKYNKGIFGSAWVGFKNFEFLFTSQDLFRIMRNTVSYAVAFIIIGNICAIAIALMLFEIKKRSRVKIYQTTMILPRFLSWVVVGYISYAILSPTQGVANQLLSFFGLEGVSWFSEPQYWPGIIIFSEVWKTVGINSIMYYAALMAIDPQLFEAAKIDGATRWQQIKNISIPSLMTLVTILMILAIGRIFRGDIGLFYQIPRDSGLLYSTTDIIDTYVYRGLRQGHFSMSTAVGMFQSVMGLTMVLFSNWIVKKRDPDRSLF